MKRWHEETHITKREQQKRINYLQNYKDTNFNKCELGRFRKKDFYDCGNPGCFLCHSNKFPKREPTNQEIKSKLSEKEQLSSDEA